MLPLAGYAERLSARPGQTLRFHVANATGAPVSARVVRVLCADPNPAIGGIRTEPVDLPVQVLAEPGPQPVASGSWAVLGPAGLVGRPGRAAALGQADGAAGAAGAGEGAASGEAPSLSFTLRIQPTLELPRRQVIASALDASGRGFALELTPALTLRATVGTTAGLALLETPAPLPLHAWSELTLVVDGAGGRLLLAAVPLAWPARGERPERPSPGPGQQAETRLAGAPVLHAPHRRLSLASASDAAPVDGFNGRLEHPVLWARALTMAEAARAAEALPGQASDGRIADWDFSREMHTQSVIDAGPHGHHGVLLNTPTRAVRASRWTGEEHGFRHAPAHYAAIHFHDDDLDDCRWPATHALALPEGLKSDAYALLLEAGQAQENIPFFVVPPRGRPSARIAVLVSTYTYTVYGNHARPEWMLDEAWRHALMAQARDWQAYPHNPGEHRDYGLSTYNLHRDGSGIGLVSWKRPMLNLRIGYITYPYPEIRGSGLRHYPADSHLLMWLAHHGHAVDLITDDELHHEGLSLLAGYRVVVTGSHPEYHTPQMLDALLAHRDGGGRLVYLGGNGFYWRIALDPTREGVIEVRRAEGGIRAWAAEPGEYHQQFDGQMGGLWRRNARPPQQLVGVGFTAQGNFVGSHYRIRPEARRDPRVSWILAGVDDETVGGEGFSGHGAAGFELDRVDHRLGSPASAVVVAQSENHPPEAPWVLVPEEQLTHITTLPGQPHKALIRADMAWFDCPGGGQVFSVGSITFCGSLPVNGFDNGVSRILHNVLTRFAADPS